MGTLADKLNKTYDTKQKIAAAIEEMSGKNPGTVFADYPDAIRAIPTGGGGWTGHADVEGLKAIGWTDEDIAYYQEHGVNWNEEDDQYHLVPEDNKALYGVVDINNVRNYLNIIVYLPKIDTGASISLNNKFLGFNNLIAVPFLDTSSVTNMSSMFQGCVCLTCVPLFDTSNVNNMSYMFSNCSSLLYVPLFDTHGVTDFRAMFQGCYSIPYVPAFETSIATSMSSMFQGCSNIKHLSIKDSSKSKNMNSMFYGAVNIIHIDMLDCSEMESCTYAFLGAYSLKYINIKNLKISLSLNNSNLLEKSSLLYMIENAAPTSSITITLSAYCYNKFSTDADVLAALSAQPLVSLASA